MTKSLVVVESPAKAKTIGKYLGRNYIVKASVGHIKDLPKSKLGVDVEDDFTPHYAVIPTKVKVVKELRAAAKGINDIYLAADPDREGEAICQHLYEELADKSKNITAFFFTKLLKMPSRRHSINLDASIRIKWTLSRLAAFSIGS